MAKLLSVLASLFVDLGNVAKLAIDNAMMLQAYAGTRKTEIALNSPVGKAFSVAILASFLKGNNIPFSTAHALDGVTFKLFENTEAYFRLFVSERQCYSGMIGMGGKARAMLETACPQGTEWAWKQQGAKNYYYTPNIEAVFQAIARK